jgi:hypothetical protein
VHLLRPCDFLYKRYNHFVTSAKQWDDTIIRTVNSNGIFSAQKISKLFVSCRGFHGRTRGCEWSLLKVRGGNDTWGQGGPRWNWKQREHLSLFQVLLKLTLTYGKGRTCDSQPLIHEWGEHGCPWAR